MIRKIVHIALWVLLAGWFTLMMGFVSRSSADILCGELSVIISDSATTKFVTDQAIREMIKNSGMNIQGYPVAGIDTRKLEKIIEEQPYVENAEVYIDIEGRLFIDVDQRKPLVRLMPGGKQGFYIDADGVILPLSKTYAPMVLLVTGFCDFKIAGDEHGVKHTDKGSDQEIGQLLGFAEYVSAHPFWSNQVVQMYRNKNGDYELIPRVGAHQVIFGPMDHYNEKLRNLSLLYDQGLKKYGWNNYDKINLKYSNQIICTKR